MSLAMLHRIKALEARMETLERAFAGDREARLAAVFQAETAPVGDRKMCPKCGEKPNYFFHVKNCTGQKKKNQDADDRPRDQSTP